MDGNAALAALCARWRDIWLLTTTSALLGWDEETMMPAAAADHRGEQLALLAGLQHERLLDDRLAALCEDAGEAGPEALAQVRAVRRAIDRARRLPRALVEEQKRVHAAAQRAWVEARERHTFSVFAPHLTRVVELKRAEARCLSVDGAASWAALLDEYEPGVDARALCATLDALRTELAPLVQRAAGRASSARLRGTFPRERQQVLIDGVARMLGFDMRRGRIDVTTHPFCSTAGTHDVRVAIRYHDQDVREALTSIAHEVGHALYEQGVPAALQGTPAGEPSSLGLHESQSRLWENQVLRGLPFWRHLLPWVARLFPEALEGARLDEVFVAINAVEPGPIRVGADEATYNLHICLRIELEQALISGALAVRELPDAWHEAYHRTLGLVPKDDREGVLQDGHWSAGMFGYFPTYTLGNLYAAQLFEAARAALPGLDDEMAAGRFEALLGWLRVHVHAHASLRSATEIVTAATGEAPGTRAFLAHLRTRLAETGQG
ncbi:MAG: carboxypeptidase M32 [Deltaproteobacteria bacterium]|nr:carboxypeptidase M32 [Deltaproteobacteria bacterium]